MTRLVILRPQQSSGELLVTQRARLRERIAARLDTQLARGVAPEAGATLAPRAHDLDKPCMRLVLARGVQRVVDEARSRQRPSRSRVPVCNAEVLAAADELAKRLRSPGHLAARGLARVHLPLTDCHSPLYLPSATGELPSRSPARSKRWSRRPSGDYAIGRDAPDRTATVPLATPVTDKHTSEQQRTTVQITRGPRNPHLRPHPDGEAVARQ